MSSVDSASGKAPALIDRAKNILLKPGAEWDRIAGESSTTQSILMGYVVILAAIGPIAALISSVVFLHNPVFGVVTAVLSYVLQIASVYVAAFVIDALATSFGGTKDSTAAFKVAAYAATPGWIAGVLGIVPGLGLLSILGVLYGLYLLYLGLPKLMKVPEDKAVGYTVVVVVVEIVLFAVMGWVVALVTAMGVGAAMLGASH